MLALDGRLSRQIELELAEGSRRSKNDRERDEVFN